MKILHILQTVSPRFGGPVKVALEMCQRLAEQAADITIFTTNRDYPSGLLDVPISQPVDRNGYRLFHFPVEFGPMMVSSQMALALSRKAANFDLMHIHGLYRFPQAAASWYARKYRIPYIIQPHGSLDPFLYYKRERRTLKRIYERLVEFRNLNNAAAIHFITTEEMRLAAFLNLKTDYIVIPVGIDVRSYKNLPERGAFRQKYDLRGKKIILHLGRITPKKGLDILASAFSRVARDRDDVVLILAGPDNEGFRHEVEKWLREGGVREKAIFTDMIEGQAKLELLRDADVFALPSYTENFGIAVVEAMACGLPVVISDKVNICQDIQMGRAGIITPCDSEAVALALNRLLENPFEAQRLGMAGKALVEEKFDWDRIIPNIMDAYRSVARNHSKLTRSWD